MHLTSATVSARPEGGRAAPPLADTARRLDAVSPALSFTAAEPLGPGWTPLAAIPESQVLAWLDQLTASASGHRVVGASYLILRLTGRIATPAVAAALLYDRGLPMSGPAAVHLDGDQFDLLAMPSGAVDVLPGDSFAGHPGTVIVDDRTVLADRVAARLFAVLAPVIETVSRHARYSTPTMWSAVADRLAGPGVVAANAGELPAHEAWDRVSAIVDRLAAHGAAIRRRPRPLDITWSGGVSAGTVKGTCCLKYIERDLRPRDAAHQPQAYCGGCPYVSDDVRVAKRRAALDARSG